MKKLLILAVAFTLSAGVFAQDKTDQKMDQKMGIKKIVPGKQELKKQF